MTTEDAVLAGNSDQLDPSLEDGSTDDVVAMLEGIEEIPLADRAEAFDAINRRIVARLADFDGI